jgi:hypothetical protein
VPYTTADTLITSVKRRAMIPTANTTFANADFLAFADEETDTGIVPLLRGVQEDYLVAAYDQALTSDVTAYRVPYRAIGAGLREVSIADADGNERRLPRVHASDLQGVTDGFYLDADEVRLVSPPENPGSDVLRLRFYMRPNRLVLNSAVTTVTAFSAVNKTVTVASVPSGYVPSASFDLVSGRPGFDTIGWDMVASTVVGSLIGFSVALPDRLAVGDYLCLAEQTTIPQMPPEFHPVLAQKVAIRCLQAMGDTEGKADAVAEHDKMVSALVPSFKNRAEANPQKAVNRGSVMRRTRPLWYSRG